jgi:hypothetical protein
MAQGLDHGTEGIGGRGGGRACVHKDPWEGKNQDTQGIASQSQEGVEQNRILNRSYIFELSPGGVPGHENAADKIFVPGISPKRNENI